MNYDNGKQFYTTEPSYLGDPLRYICSDLNCLE